MRKTIRTRAIRRAAIAVAAIIPAIACSDPTGIDELSDFLILSPGDYFFATPITLRPSAASTDSVLVRWEHARGAESYTIIFAQAVNLDSLRSYTANLSQPTFTIPVTAPQEIKIDYGIPNPLLDTIPVAQYPALQYVLKLNNLDAALATQPKGVPLYFLWSIEAQKGSKKVRSLESHRLVIIRS